MMNYRRKYPRINGCRTSDSEGFYRPDSWDADYEPIIEVVGDGRCVHRPGSDAKIDAMIERYAAGQPLFRADDCEECLLQSRL